MVVFGVHTLQFLRGEQPAPAVGFVQFDALEVSPENGPVLEHASHDAHIDDTDGVQVLFSRI